MKRFVVFLMMIVLALPVLSVYGSEADSVMLIVKCPEQGFSTLCSPDCTYEFTPDGGTAISLDESMGGGTVTIFKVDAPGGDFAAEIFFNNAYLNLLEASYGDDLADPGEYTVYPFAGKELPGRMALYWKDGALHMRFCLYDLQDDYFVQYEAFSVFEEEPAQNTVDVMSDAIRYLMPDPDYYNSESTEDTSSSELQTIECPEQGFSVQADPSYSWDYKEGTGITIYTRKEGMIPYVIVYQSEDLIMEPYEYICEQFTPYMEQKYGADLISAEEYESFECGGKFLSAGVYTYDIDGHTVTMLRIMDSGGDQTVVYTAKYEDADMEETRNALDTAITTFSGR